MIMKGTQIAEDLLVTCKVATPVADKPPSLDALLLYMQDAKENGGRGSKTIMRTTKVDGLDVPAADIGLDLFELEGMALFCCSDPIWVMHGANTDHIGCRFDLAGAKQALAPGQAQHATDNSGPHKPRFIPVQLYNIAEIAWFCRGDQERIRRLLHGCKVVGKYRREGYGQVVSWTVAPSPVGAAWYTVAPPDNTEAVKPVLMRRVPATTTQCPYSGATLGRGAAMPPYWHGGRQIDVWRPC